MRQARSCGERARGLVRAAVGRLLLGLGAMGAVTLTAPAALGAPADNAATSAYVRADYALVRAINANLPRSEAELLRLRAQAGRECPLAAAGSPQDPESTQLSDELIGAMVLNGARSDRGAVRAFTVAVKSLRWRDRALTGAIQGYAAKLRTLLALAAPPLCADVKAWAATRFTSLPARTVSFARVFMAAWVGAGELPSELAVHESTADRALARRAARLEELVSEFEARAVETYSEIMSVLALSP
jgi:hypothetical protein